MSDTGEVEVPNPAGNLDVLPKEVTAEIGSVKLFNKWSYEDVEIRDISLTCDINYHLVRTGRLNPNLQ
jgi:small subunit ribosomal protein S5e